MPRDAAARAEAQLLVSRYDQRFVPAFYKLLRAAAADVATAAAKELVEEFGWLEAQLAARPSGSGPYVLGGDAPSLADAALAPWLLRLPLLDHFRCEGDGALLGRAYGALRPFVAFSPSQANKQRRRHVSCSFPAALSLSDLPFAPSLFYTPYLSRPGAGSLTRQLARTWLPTLRRCARLRRWRRP